MKNEELKFLSICSQSVLFCTNGISIFSDSVFSFIKLFYFYLISFIYLFILLVFLGIGFCVCCSDSYWCDRYAELEMVFDYNHAAYVLFSLHWFCKFLNLTISSTYFFVLFASWKNTEIRFTHLYFRLWYLLYEQAYFVVSPLISWIGNLTIFSWYISFTIYHCQLIK